MFQVTGPSSLTGFAVLLVLLQFACENGLLKSEVSVDARLLIPPMTRLNFGGALSFLAACDPLVEIEAGLGRGKDELETDPAETVEPMERAADASAHNASSSTVFTGKSTDFATRGFASDCAGRACAGRGCATRAKLGCAVRRARARGVCAKRV